MSRAAKRIVQINVKGYEALIGPDLHIHVGVAHRRVLSVAAASICRDEAKAADEAKSTDIEPTPLDQLALQLASRCLRQQQVKSLRLAFDKAFHVKTLGAKDGDYIAAALQGYAVNEADMPLAVTLTAAAHYYLSSTTRRKALPKNSCASGGEVGRPESKIFPFAYFSPLDVVAYQKTSNDSRTGVSLQLQQWRQELQGLAESIAYYQQKLHGLDHGSERYRRNAAKLLQLKQAFLGAHALRVIAEVVADPKAYMPLPSNKHTRHMIWQGAQRLRPEWLRDCRASLQKLLTFRTECQPCVGPEHTRVVRL